MRKTLLLSATILSLATGGAFAQNATGSSQTPASPNSSSNGAMPSNSLPQGAQNSSQQTPGANLGTAATAPYPAKTVGQPVPGLARPHYRMNQASAQRGAVVPAATAADQPAPPTSAYRGGAGSPSSTVASNILPSDTRSDIAPRLPSPDASANTPRALLASAQRALSRGRTGEAQQALEMAETRALSRTTTPDMADMPDEAMMVKHIGEARRALGRRDMAGANQAITMAMAAPVPPRGPDVNTSVINPAPMSMPMGQPMLGAPPRTY